MLSRMSHLVSFGIFWIVQVSLHSQHASTLAAGVEVTMVTEIPEVTDMTQTSFAFTDCNSSVTEGHNASSCHGETSNEDQDEEGTGSEASQSSSSSRSSRSDPYGNGQMTKKLHDSLMQVLDPARFTLILVAIPLLFLTVISFAREKTITVSNSFVLAINLFEALSSTLNAVYYVMKYSLSGTDEVFIVWVLLCNYGIVCCRRVAYIFNLLLCVQRLAAIVSPIKSRHTFTHFWRNCTFATVITCCFLGHVYLALMYDPKDVGRGMYVMARTKWYSENKFIFSVVGTVAKFSFSYIPLLLSLVTNFFLIVVLKRHNLRSKKLRTTKDDDAKERQERQMTLMILVSTMAFTILSLPPNVNHMVSSFVDSYGTRMKDHYLFQVVKSCCNSLQTIGDLTNFLSYLLLSTTFRKQFRKTVLWCIPQRRSDKSQTAFTGVTSKTDLHSQDKSAASTGN